MANKTTAESESIVFITQIAPSGQYEAYVENVITKLRRFGKPVVEENSRRTTICSGRVVVRIDFE